MLVELVFGIHGKLSVAASVKRTTPDFQFALRLDSGQFLVFVSPENPKTISSEAFERRRAEVGPVDALCGDAFRHGALVDALEKAFRAAGTDRTAKAVVLQQWVAPQDVGTLFASEGLHLARVDPTAKAASLGRAEADRLAYWLRAYAMRWYRDGNALQRYRLVDNRRPADGCGECGGQLVESFCYAMGRDARRGSPVRRVSRSRRGRRHCGRADRDVAAAACARVRRRRRPPPRYSCRAAGIAGTRAPRRAKAGRSHYPPLHEVAPRIYVRRLGLQSQGLLRRALRELADVPVRCAVTSGTRRWSTDHLDGRPRGRALLPVPPQAHVRQVLRRRHERARELGPLGGAWRASRRTSATSSPRTRRSRCCGRSQAPRRPQARHRRGGGRLCNVRHIRHRAGEMRKTAKPLS